MTATCRSCGTEIIFIKTPQGKFIPCEPELVSADDCEVGTMLVTKEGEVYKVRGAGMTLGEDCEVMQGYVSHFAFCSHASDFRRQRGNQ